MARTTQIRWAIRFASLALVASVCPIISYGQDTTDAVSEDRRAATRAAARESTRAVVARIVESADFLAAQKRFRFESRTTYDVLQINEQMLEFGASQTVTVRRPDRVRIDRVNRNGASRSMTFDGKTIAVDLPGPDAYVSVEKPGRLDAAIDYLVDDLGTPAPLHEFMSDNYYDEAADEVRSAFWVDTEEIGGELCDHLAFRGANVDVQLWLRVGDTPLPCRMVVTHVDHVGSPQFSADFDAWNLAPKVPDSLFEFTPPEGAERLTVQAVRQQLRSKESKP